MPRKLTEEQIVEVCRRYAAGESSTVLAKEYDVWDRTLVRHIKIRNGAIRTLSERNRRYHCDDNFFSNIDTEPKAYWLGFLMADGCVNEANNYVTLGLASKDKDHLKSYLQCIGGNYPIRDFSKNKIRKSCVEIYSRQIVQDLSTNCVTQAKTFNPSFPALNSNLHRHYLRGWFDGDGGFGTPKSGYTRKDGTKAIDFNFHITLNEKVLPKVQEILVANCNLSCVRAIPHSSTVGLYVLKYTGHAQCLRIANWMYEDATIYLTRKRIIALRHFQDLCNYRHHLRFG